MSIVKKKELNLEMASEALNRMLVGAYLDCFNVSSIQVSLKFINTVASPGKYLYVDNSFSCEAVLGGDEDVIIDASAERFFIRRSKFLADVYFCIGMEVKNIDLKIDGSLTIFIGDSFINVKLAPEDMHQEESVWSVEMEAPAGHILSVINYIVCVPKDVSVSFYHNRIDEK